MFSQNQEEVKLEWMYKGPHATVEREEYLLGRSVDKTLEQINAEEKQQIGITQPKNHVEHECIPPSIREYKLQRGDQVDITTKLQEDPLISIKKQEEEKRRQFLNNPVQIKKLQKALKAQKKNKHRSSDSDKDLDAKLVHKLKLLKGGGNLLGHKKSKKSKVADLDTILMHKYNQLKSKLSDTDLQDIFEGTIHSSSSSSSDCSSSSSSEDERKEIQLKKNNSKTTDKRNHETHKKSEHKAHGKLSRNFSRERSDSKQERYEKQVSHNSIKQKPKHDQSRSYERKFESRKRSKYEYKNRDRKIDSDHNTSHGNIKHKSTKHNTSQSHEHKGKSRKTYKSEHKDRDNIKKRRYSSESHSSSSSDSDSEQPKKKNWGLVKADGTKIPVSVKHASDKSNYVKPQVKIPQAKPTDNRNHQHLTKEEKEKRLQEMLTNASWREKERSRNLESHRKGQLQEDEETKAYNPKFLQKELLKSANNGSVESRIKANINNIQRSGNDMNKHFSRR